MVEELLKEIIDKFNKKVESDPKLKAEIQGLKKVIHVEITDGEQYHFTLENAHVGELNKGTVQNPDIKIIGSAETLLQVSRGEMGVMKAYATKKIQVKGKLEDVLRLRKFF
jgi:putative sterol carrier protein